MRFWFVFFLLFVCLSASAQAEVLIMRGKTYLDGATVLKNDKGMIIIEKNGKAYRIPEKNIRLVVPTVPAEGYHPLDLRAFENSFKEINGEASQGFRGRVSFLLSKGIIQYAYNEYELFVETSLTLGYQWRFLESVSWDFDAGVATGLINTRYGGSGMTVSPVITSGIMFHMPDTKLKNEY